MPKQEEVFNVDSKRDLYTNLKSTLKSILIAIEENLSQKKLKKDDISIEHIFPQNPTDQEWKEICEKSGIDKNITFDNIKEWINTLGNLSILDKDDNSRLSNKIFNKKKKILEDKSYLKINRMLYDYDTWNVEEIQDRAKKILEHIKNIWF